MRNVDDSRGRWSDRREGEAGDGGNRKRKRTTGDANGEEIHDLLFTQADRRQVEGNGLTAGVGKCDLEIVVAGR